MRKIYAQNLSLIITERCNFNCAHCMRGESSNKVMSDDVISATLDQFEYIQNLTICGGEITLALNTLEKVFSYIIFNHIKIDMVNMVINGSIYSEKFLTLLDYMERYINLNNRRGNQSVVNFVVSWDDYHYNEADRLGILSSYLENIKKYKLNTHFKGLQKLGNKLFAEGNALKLDSSMLSVMKPITPQVTYVGRFNRFDMKNGRCNIGPSIAVNVDGVITECDASTLNQNTIYNYGNVLCDSIEDVSLGRGVLVRKPRKWFKATYDEIEKYKK